MALPHLAVEIFCSYAHEDEEYRQQLEIHVSALKRQGLIAFWHDQLILPGSNWAHTIGKHLETASIIVLLISADFIASDYCYEVEMKRALARHEANEAYVVPVVVRPCRWRELPLASLQALPTDGKPISMWVSRDDAWTHVATGLRRIIEDVSLLPASAPRSFLPPIWMIPYPRNPFFLGRDKLLSQIHGQLQAGQATALSQPQAISGLGGIGKTQIAVEYAYRYSREYQIVLWARAESIEVLSASYSQLATKLNLPEKEAQEQEAIIEGVKTWLQDHSNWLLVLDNADELALLKDFLPPFMGGHLIVTTRAQAMGRLAHRIEVEAFSPEDGALFLLRRSALTAPDASLEQVATEDRQLAKQITQELGGLPLALDQAGAYLEETGYGLAEYEHLYLQHRVALLKERRGIVSDHPESVTTTWSLSIQRVEEKNPAAADLLRMLAFFAPDAIGEEILTKGSVWLGPVLDPVVADAFLFNQAIEVLRAYSLIKRDRSAKTLSLHRLVQVVIRESLSAEDREQWIQKTIAAVKASFASIEVTQWMQCERCLPHALVCSWWIEQAQISSLLAMKLLYLSWNYLYERGRYKEAEVQAKQTLAIHEKALGSEHSQTAVSLHNLAIVYYKQARYEEAQSLLEHALVIQERKMGPEHYLTTQCLNSLAVVYSAQGRDEEARSLFERALASRDNELLVLPYVPILKSAIEAERLNNLAAVYENQGKYTEAEPLYNRALVIYERTLGPEHPQTANCLSNLALLYEKRGKYAEAQPLYNRALVICKRTLGFEHPQTANCLNNLASLYEKRGKYAEAQPLYEQALAIYEKILGPEHPKVGMVVNNLGGLYVIQMRYEEAVPLVKRTLTIYERTLGSEHPQTALYLHNLAFLYDSQGRYEEAQLLYNRVLTTYEKALGPEHPQTADCLNSLAVSYRNQGKYTEAQRLCEQSLAIRERVLGPKHPDIAYSLNDLALIYHKKRRYIEAESLHQRALEIREQHLGLEHSATAVSLNNLALLYHEQEKYIQAEPLYQRALAIREQQLGPEHPSTQDTHKNYAILLRVMGRDDEAKQMEKQA